MRIYSKGVNQTKMKIMKIAIIKDIGVRGKGYPHVFTGKNPEIEPYVPGIPECKPISSWTRYHRSDLLAGSMIDWSEAITTYPEQSAPTRFLVRIVFIPWGGRPEYRT